MRLSPYARRHHMPLKREFGYTGYTAYYYLQLYYTRFSKKVNGIFNKFFNRILLKITYKNIQHDVSFLLKFLVNSC